MFITSPKNFTRLAQVTAEEYLSAQDLNKYFGSLL
jgi:hypothetical protein